MHSRLHVVPEQRCRLTFTSVLTTDMFSTWSRGLVTSRVQTARPAAARRRARSRYPRLSTRARVFTQLTTAPDRAPGMEAPQTASRHRSQNQNLDQSPSPKPALLHLPVLLLKPSRQAVGAAGIGIRAAVLPTLTAQAVTPISPSSGPGTTCAP